ncbi:MAG: ISAon1 family transposase [Arcticibacter sp.]
MDTAPNSVETISSFYGVKVKNLLRQYRDNLSDFKSWDQKPHAKKWLLYPQNLGEQLSIDETSLSHGELYTIVTNKAAKGKKGAIVALVAGTKAETVISVLQRIPERIRKKVREITLDMAGSMEMISKRCFPQAVRVTDRFHVQKLATEALQEMRIKQISSNEISSCKDDFLEEKPYSQYSLSGLSASTIEAQLVGLHRTYAELWGYSGDQGFVAAWHIGTDIASAGSTQGVEKSGLMQRASV